MLMKINKFFGLLLAICFLLSATPTESYRYLAVAPWPATSHSLITSSIFKGLVAKGHEVVVITPYLPKEPIKNYKVIHVPGVTEAMKPILANLLNWIDRNFVQSYIDLLGLGTSYTEALFAEPQIQALLRSNETFDAVLVEVFVNEAMYGFAEHFNAPLVGICTFGAISWNTDMTGSPSPPSYVPHLMLSFTEKMTLWQRILNLAFITFERVYSDWVYLPQQEAIYNANFPNAKRSMYEVRKNTALVLLNQHVSLSFPRPYTPNQIEVGGVQINPQRKPLPPQMQKFIDEAKHGVIYFSMGSNLKSKNLPMEKREAILKTFRGLKQRVMWKFEDENLPNKPDNVFISDWFPQDDILAHPNVKFFITHGGLLSTTESIYHAKPFIGIPIFGDQFLNMQRAERYGYGISLNYKELSADSFKAAIDRMLNDPSYTKLVRDVSGRLRDQPMQPLDRAVFWLEHVVRQKGAEYLHCAGLDLNFLQYHNIDAMLILYGGLLLIPITVIILITLLLKMCLGKKSSRHEKKKVKRN